MGARQYMLAILGIFAMKSSLNLVFLLGFMAFVKEGSLGISGLIFGWIFIFYFIFCPI